MNEKSRITLESKLLQPKEHFQQVANPIDHLDQLLTKKIDHGPAQQKLSSPLFLMLFSEGCQSIVLGFLLPILAKEWSLSILQQSMIITVVYVGVAFGSYLQVYSDKHGRYAFITYNAILQSLFGLLSCVCWNYSSFLVARFFYGVGIGICIPLSATYITEIAPAHMRASLITRSRIWWSAGCLVTCLLGWLFLASNSWRWLLFVIWLPGIYALIQHRSNGRESLRYLWVQGKTVEVYNLVDYMCNLNNKPKISQSQIYQLMLKDGTIKTDDNKNQQNTEDIPLSVMFEQQYSSSTIRLFVCWFAVSFIHYGILLLLPMILARTFISTPSQHHTKYLFLIGITTVQVLAAYLSISIMDHPRIGRKKTVYIGMYIIFAVTILILMIRQRYPIFLFFLFLILKFTVTTIFNALNSYTAEIYQTMIRGKAFGVCSMVGRIAIILLGVAGISSLGWFGGNGLYVIFVVLSVAAGYGGQTMPYCTHNRPIK